MDALLLSLMLCMLVELRSGAARLYAGLPAGREGALQAMPPLVALPVASLSAIAGAALAPGLTPEARHIFLAAALAVSGGSLFFVKAQEAAIAPEGETRGRAVRCGLALRFPVAALSGNAPFLIAAIALAYADPWLAGIGGGLGMALAWFAARQTGAGAAPTLRLVLYGAGSLMLGVGFVVAMSALRLI